jgi:hypothetical protein
LRLRNKENFSYSLAGKKMARLYVGLNGMKPNYILG